MKDTDPSAAAISAVRSLQRKCCSKYGRPMHCSICQVALEEYCRYELIMRCCVSICSSHICRQGYRHCTFESGCHRSINSSQTGTRSFSLALFPWAAACAWGGQILLGNTAEVADHADFHCQLSCRLSRSVLMISILWFMVHDHHLSICIILVSSNSSTFVPLAMQASSSKNSFSECVSLSYRTAELIAFVSWPCSKRTRRMPGRCD